MGIRGSLVKLPVIRDGIVFSVVGRDDRGDFNRDMATVASTEPANQERTANPWAQDGRKVELDRSVSPFLELLPSVNEELYTSRIDVGNSREVENEGTKEWLRSVMGGGVYAAPRGGLVPRTVNEADGTGVLATSSVKSKPLLRAIVLDFSAVPNVDTTGVQILIDTRRELEKWADGPVEFHFATILSPWVRRALLVGGFGIGDGSHIPVEVAPVVPAHDQEYDQITDDWRLHRGSVHQDLNTSGDDLEGNGDDKVNPSDGGRDGTEFSSQGPLVSTLTPFFHVDLPSAVRAAEARATKGKDSKH